MFKPAQKIRVIINGISVYTTARQIRDGFGDYMSINEAVKLSLESLERANASGDGAVGLCGDFAGRQIQINMRT